jgi:DHA1 family tetracycline resistance protein-like MFS transporter
MSSPNPVAPRRGAVVFIFVTLLLDSLALGVSVPVFPKLVLTFEGGDTASAAAVFGAFGTVFALMQLFCAPLLGALSDRFGRRPVILLSIFGLGFDYVLMALAPTLGWLFVGRVVSGICAANFSTAGAYIADVTPPDKRAASFGMLGAAFGVGFTLGPALGGLLGSVSLRLPFWVAAGLTLANAVYGLAILPESLPRERRVPFRWREANPLGALALLRSIPVVFGLAGVVFLHRLAHDVQPSMFVLYTGYRYGWDERTVGLVLMGVGVLGALLSAGAVGPVVKRIGERRALLLGLASGALGFSAYGLAATGAAFLTFLPVVALWGGFTGPALQALITRRVDPSEQGRLQGALASLGSVASVLAPGLFTGVFAAAVRGDAPPVLPGAPFLLAGALLALSFALALRVAR